MILTGKAKLAGVMGWPVGHSKSPRLHGYWLEQFGLDGAYLPLSVAPEDFEAVLKALPRMGFAGVNVTVPHKEAALAVSDTLTDQALRIGAVNTIVFGEDGKIHGSNTDGYGFLENLKFGAPEWSAKNGPVVVIGAGGAARAVCAALIDDGVPEVRVINRTQAKALALAADIQGDISVLPNSALPAALKDTSLLVNTTILGMVGSPPLEINLDGLPTSAVVTDIVYAPLQTNLLKSAAARGNVTVDGLGMLLHQARPGFEAWFGANPEVTPALRKFVLES